MADWIYNTTTTDLPEQLREVDIAIPLPDPGDDPTGDEVCELMVAHCDGDDHDSAVLAAFDTFFRQWRLGAQKAIKEQADDSTTVEEAIEIARAHREKPVPRVRGISRAKSGGASATQARRQAKQATDTAEDMLAELEELDPDRAEAYRERMEALGV